MADDLTRLYLMLPPAVTAADAPGLLKAALEAGDVACLCIQTDGIPDDAARALVSASMKACTPHETAVLVSNPQFAKVVDCDGAHVTLRSGEPEKEVAGAVKALKPRYILGVGGLRNRHSAMAAGELDIDYVMFGEPAPDGYVPPLEQTEERTAWWAEIFNVPCVAYASRLDDIATLVTAGADFIALREAVWSDARSPAAAVQDAMKRIAGAPARIVAEEP